MHSSIRLRLLSATAILALGFVSAHAQNSAPTAPQNVASATQPAKADADMQKVLDTLASLNGKPVETLSPSEARKQPTPTDAVMKIIKDEKLKVDPHAGLKVSNSRFADMGNLKLRYYTPENATKDSKLPVVVYFRGGGWVIADLDVYDSSPAAIARKANAIVVSVDYPMAPEHKFPAAHDEAIEAYKYIAKNAQSWGGDPAKIAIVGESAGGNLAINTALAAHTQNLAMPVSVVAVYPVASNNLETPSEKQYAAAKPLNQPMMAWFFDKVLENPDQKTDQRLNLVSVNFKGLPPVTIINAEIDPLKSDGDMLADKMKADGVNVTHKLYTGVTHEFFGMDAVVAKAKEAQDFAVSQLKLSFNGAATTGTAPAK
jgi:acetyl esterase